MAVNGNERRWIQWLMPAAILGMCSVAFSSGVFVERSRMAIEMEVLRQQVHAHIESPRHAGVPSTEVIELRFMEVMRRLDDLEEALERLRE